MKVKQDKYIDLSQFVYNKNGCISWKDSEGIIAEFFYNGKRHELEILEYLKEKHCRLKIRVDDVIFDDVSSAKIKNLSFDDLFYEVIYKYNIGDIVEDALILEQCRIKIKTPQGTGLVQTKAYKCKCLIDNHEYIVLENQWHKCPVCSNQIVIKGTNDVGTTNPELVSLFLNEEDAYTHTKGSGKKVSVRCPYCGKIKQMKVFELTTYGYVTCDRCADRICYPNKFSHELFRQLSNQYDEYIIEYSPDWANKYSYDNYIRLSDNKEIIVEMDGRFHFEGKLLNLRKFNDSAKDSLAADRNIIVIRVNCDYGYVCNRYNYIKNNIITSLQNYFDLSGVNWDKCNEAGLSNMVHDVSIYYNEHPYMSLQKIADHFHVCMDTLYGYLNAGSASGLCSYVKFDPKRTKNSKPVSVHNVNGDFIGIYKSLKEIETIFVNEYLKSSTIQKHLLSKENKPYKGYIFNYVSYEEYWEYLENCQYNPQYN